jgi:vacuolar iron transporter family protein
MVLVAAQLDALASIDQDAFSSSMNSDTTSRARPAPSILHRLWGLSTRALSDLRADLRSVSFGSPAAIVTSMALIVGLDAATVSRVAVMGSLLIIGIADNLTDSLSVHIYQESERLAEREAFRTTVANYFARLVVSLSFVALVLLLPASLVIYVSVLWGFVLLAVLSHLLARARGVSSLGEIAKHTGVAVVVIAISKGIGLLIGGVTGSI